MATITLRQTQIVGEGGRIELVLPELEVGETVEVSVERRLPDPHAGKRPLGSLKGSVHMTDRFNDPIEGFEPYTR